MKRLWFIIVIVLFLAGCGEKESLSEAEVETVVSVALTASVPTSTTFQATETSPPQLTKTPTFSVFTAQEAVDAFISAGLEVGEFAPLTKDDYGLAPYVGQGIHFFVPSLGSGKGGRVFAFENNADLDLLRTYYEELGRSSAVLFSWVFVHENILVQINGDLSEDQARKYEATINAMSH